MPQGRKDADQRGPTDADAGAPAPSNTGPKSGAAAAERLRETIGTAAFDRYFCGPTVVARGAGTSALARLDADDAGRLRVRVANRFAGSLIEQRFSAALAAAARAEGLGAMTIEVDPEAGTPRAAEGPIPGKGVDRGSEGDRGAPPRPWVAPGRGSASPRNGRTASFIRESGYGDRRLEDFVVGPSNRAAYEAACRMGDAASDPGFGPLVIYGDCGVGKSHLLRGVASRFAETAGTGARSLVRSTTAEAFMSAYVEAVKASRVPAFQRQFRRVALLCIDDVHFLASKDGTQRELLHTFDALDLTGARVVLVTDEHPRDIAKLSDPLVSRFVGGVVVRIDAPDDELAERIVDRMASRRGLRLADGAARAVVTWVRTAARSRGGEGAPASARDLAGAVARVKATCSVSPNLLAPDGSVGAVMVDAALSPAGASGDGAGQAGSHGGYRRGRAAIREIIEASASTLGVTVGEVLGRGRHKRVVLARSVASYLCREMTNHSTPEIAVKLGRPNHSTVVTASQRIAKMIAAGERVAVGGASDGLLVSDVVGEIRRRVSAGR